VTSRPHKPLRPSTKSSLRATDLARLVVEPMLVTSHALYGSVIGAGPPRRRIHEREPTSSTAEQRLEVPLLILLLLVASEFLLINAIHSCGTGESHNCLYRSKRTGVGMREGEASMQER
jgi:hypothetical protein